MGRSLRNVVAGGALAASVAFSSGAWSAHTTETSINHEVTRLDQHAAKLHDQVVAQAADDLAYANQLETIAGEASSEASRLHDLGSGVNNRAIAGGVAAFLLLGLAAGVAKPRAPESIEVGTIAPLIVA